MNVPRKYGLVRAIAFILKLLGWLALIAGIVAAVTAGNLFGANAPAFLQILRSVGIIAGPVLGIIWWVQLYAFGSILSLLVDIEENTRALTVETPVVVEKP